MSTFNINSLKLRWIGTIALLVATVSIAYSIFISREIPVPIKGTAIPFPSEPGKVLYGSSDVPVTLYSLIPETGNEYNPSKLPTFHDYPILGKVELTSSEAVAAFSNTINKIEDKYTDVSSFLMCIWSPRHGIAFQRAGKKYTVLICFECGQIQAYCDGQLMGPSHSYGGSTPEIDADWRFISGSPDNLNAVLKSAGIPINFPTHYEKETQER